MNMRAHEAKIKNPAYNNPALISNNLEVTEFICSQILSLPIYPELGRDKINIVAELLSEYFSNNHRS